MTNVNIFEKIFEIMNEYENCTETYIYNNFSTDNFFNYIFKNININSVPLDKSLNEPLNIPLNKSLDEPLDKPLDKSLDKPLDKSLNEPLDKSLNEPLDKSLNEPLDEHLDESLNEIKKYMKKCYKKIVLITHPDKNGDQNIFIKCQTYYEESLLIGILYLCYLLKLDIPPINDIIVNRILIEIRIIQEKIILKKKYI